MNYYRIDHDFPEQGRWYLGGLFDSNDEKLDSRIFRYGKLVELEPLLRIPRDTDGELIDVKLPLYMVLYEEGPRLDFTLGAFDVPVVLPFVADLLIEVAAADIQSFPVEIYPPGNLYYIVNVIANPDCLDVNRSVIQWWTESDGRPDKLGKPKMVSKTVINTNLTNGHHILRPKNWEVELIVSETVKNALESANVSGINFQLVTE